MGKGKKSHPVAICSACGAYSSDLRDIHRDCRRVINGKRCKGSFGSKLAPGDWQECSKCLATGEVNGAPCLDCGGIGWLLCGIAP